MTGRVTRGLPITPASPLEQRNAPTRFGQFAARNEATTHTAGDLRPLFGEELATVSQPGRLPKHVDSYLANLI